MYLIPLLFGIKDCCVQVCKEIFLTMIIYSQDHVRVLILYTVYEKNLMHADTYIFGVIKSVNLLV